MNYKFSNGKAYKSVTNVKELIEELQRLPHPESIPVGTHDTPNGADIVVFNASQKTRRYVSIDDFGFWDED